jgi:hypothetical protein
MPGETLREEPQAHARRRVPHARIAKRGGGRSARGLAASRAVGNARGCEPRRLAHDRRRARVPRPAARAKSQARGGPTARAPSLSESASMVRIRSRSVRSPTPSASRYLSSSKSLRPPSALRSSCTICSASPSKRSRPSWGDRLATRFSDFLCRYSTGSSRRVTRFSKELDPRTRTMLTEVELDNKDARFYPGTFVRAAIVFGDRPAVLAPPTRSSSMRANRKLPYSATAKRTTCRSILPPPTARTCDFGRGA